MKNSDEAVEKIMHGLRNAEPPAGMDQRILKRIEERAAARSERSDRTWKPWSLALYGMALAAVILIAVAISVRHPVAKLPTQAAVKRPSAGVKVSSPVAEIHAPPYAIPASRKSVHPRKPQPHLAQETKEASYPAPPMPLTEQERLLLKLAHQGDPEELATLTHDGLAIQSAEEKDFKNFFGQPAKGDYE